MIQGWGITCTPTIFHRAASHTHTHSTLLNVLHYLITRALWQLHKHVCKATGGTSRWRLHFLEQHKHPPTPPHPVGRGWDTVGDTCSPFGRGRPTASRPSLQHWMWQPGWRRGDGRRAELHPPLPWLCVSISPREPVSEEGLSGWMFQSEQSTKAEGAERWALHGHTVAYYPRAGVMSFDPNPLIRSCCSAAVYMIPSRWV